MTKRKQKDRQKPEPAPRFWADVKHADGKMVWGVECDDSRLTFDGYYVLLVPQGSRSFEDTALIASKIADALNGRRSLRVAKKPAMQCKS